MLLLCFRSLAQQSHSISVAKEKAYPFYQDMLTASVTVNTEEYTDYVISLTIPKELYRNTGSDINSGLEVTGGSEQVKLTNITRVESGDNWKVSFSLSFQKAERWNDISIPFYGFNETFINTVDCSNPLHKNIVFELSGRLKVPPVNSSGEFMVSATLVAVVPKGSGNKEPNVQIREYNQGDADSPFYYTLYVGNTYDITKLRVAMSFNTTYFSFISAKRYSGVDNNSNFNEYGFYNGENVNASVVGDSLIFETDNSVHAGGYYYIIYLRPQNSLGSMPPINVKVRENSPGIPLTSQNECGIIKRYAETSYTGTPSINYTPGTYKPSLNYYFQNADFSTCKDYCYKIQNKSIRIEFNNAYVTSATTKSIKVSMRNNTKVKSIKFFNQYQSPVLGTFQVRYKICGQSSEIIKSYSSITENASINQSLEYLIIENIPVAALSANDFELSYEDDDLPGSCGYSNRFEIGIIGEPVISVASTVNISSSCDLKKVISDRYYDNTFFNSGEEGFVRICLRSDETTPPGTQLPGIYTYNNIKYSLDPKMFFTSEALKYYIGTDSDPALSEFKPYNSWTGSQLVAPGFSVVKGTLLTLKNDLFITNLKVYNTCGQNVYFYILAKVKTKDKLPIRDNDKVYQSTVESTDANLKPSLQTWNNRGSYVLRSKTLLYCGRQNFGNSTVRLGESIVIDYVMENTGPGKLSNLSLDLNKLKIGDLAIPPLSVASLYVINDENDTVSARTNIDVSLDHITIPDILYGYSKIKLSLVYQIPSEIQYSGKIAISYFKSGGIMDDNTVTSGAPSDTLELTISPTYSSCTPISCSECVTSFSPQAGHKYLLSAWVKEPLTDVTKTFINTGIRITYNNGELSAEDGLFVPSGPIIDGWQRIEKAFRVPFEANNIQIELVNNSDKNKAYFDDIRIHPFKSNMKSFVYDQSTQKLVAELDENNYATYYEYDDEGILIRVKKETERGVMSIKESRNNQSKIFKNNK